MMAAKTGLNIIVVLNAVRDLNYVMGLKMKLYEITALVYADDDLDEKAIKDLIDRDLNRGDGIFLDIEIAKLELIRTEAE
jgi:hypothetical protein